MSRLKFTDKIRQEETSKIKPVILGLVIILALWLVLNHVIRTTPAVKLVSWVVFALALICLLIVWYRAYYKS